MKKVKKTKSKITKAQIKKVLAYVATLAQVERLKGMQNDFVFDIRSQIEWIDGLEGKEFHSKHYSPLVYAPIPDMKRGSIIYDDFWDEQDRRCLEGYAPIVDGVQYPRITGPHYFYLNNVKIMMLKFGEKKKKLNYPYYRALDHMIFLELEKADKDGYGIIVGKARRMGLSYIGSVMILWNLIFFKGNTCAVGAGIEDKALLLFSKLVTSLENLREEYRVSYKKTKNKLRLVYDIREHKVRKDKGIMSELDVKTFFNNPSAFEGGSYSFFIFEEIGIHDNLIKSYKASEPAFMEGKKQFGVPFLFGTGGEVDKGSKDFKIIWKNPKAYNMKKLFVPAYMYYPGEVDTDDEDFDPQEENANFFDVRTGLNDEKAALKHILKRRVIARKSKEGYIKEVQSRPIKESDLFLKTDGGLLNRIALAAQREAIYNKENKYTYSRGRYEWIDPPNLMMALSRCRNTKEKNLIRIRNKVPVEFIEDEDGNIYKLDGFQPINTPAMPYNPDIAGTDSYDEENVVESKSLGASVVYRCFSGYSKDYDIPVALILERGDASADDVFFDNVLKQGVFWRCKNLIEYTKTAIFGYFLDVEADHLLALNPDIRKDILTNKGRQTYGVRMTQGDRGAKSLVTKLLKFEVKENVQNIHFEILLDELIEYGSENTDLAMAFGCVLIHKLDIFDFITDDLEEAVDDGDVLMDMAYYGQDEQGNLVMRSYLNDDDPAGSKLETFDPRKHLDPEDRENYLKFVEERKKKILEDREKAEQAYVESRDNREDIFSSSIKEFLNQQK